MTALLLMLALAASPTSPGAAACQSIRESFWDSWRAPARCAYQWDEMDRGWAYLVELRDGATLNQVLDVFQYAARVDAKLRTRTLRVDVFSGRRLFSVPMLALRACARYGGPGWTRCVLGEMVETETDPLVWGQP